MQSEIDKLGEAFSRFAAAYGKTAESHREALERHERLFAEALASFERLAARVAEHGRILADLDAEVRRRLAGEPPPAPPVN